jgi:hypothetical protein
VGTVGGKLLSARKHLRIADHGRTPSPLIGFTRRTDVPNADGASALLRCSALQFGDGVGPSHWLPHKHTECPQVSFIPNEPRLRYATIPLHPRPASHAFEVGHANSHQQPDQGGGTGLRPGRSVLGRRRMVDASPTHALRVTDACSTRHRRVLGASATRAAVHTHHRPGWRNGTPV